MATFLPQDDHVRLHRTSREWRRITSHRCASPVLVQLTRVAAHYPLHTHLRPHRLLLLYHGNYRNTYGPLLPLVSDMVSIRELTLKITCNQLTDWAPLQKLVALRNLTIQVPDGIESSVFCGVFRSGGAHLERLLIRGGSGAPMGRKLDWFDWTEYLPKLRELVVDYCGSLYLFAQLTPLLALERFVRIRPLGVPDIIDLTAMPNLTELDESHNTTVDLRGYRTDFRLREEDATNKNKRSNLKLDSRCQGVVFYYSPQDVSPHQEELFERMNLSPRVFARLCERLSDWRVLLV